MHTVPITAAHLPYCASIASQAFADAPHYRFLRPRHDEYPERGYYYYLRKILTRCASPDVHLRVALSDDSDAWYNEAEGEQVVGYSIWTRTWGEGESREEVGEGWWKQDTFANKFDRFARSWMNFYDDLVNPDPAQEPTRAQAFANVGSQFARLMSVELDKQPKSKGHIFLQALVVDPSLHRNGIGARLLKWGIERSGREDVPIVLASAAKATGLYEKFDWKSVGEISIEGVEWGDLIMVRWPKGRKEIEAEELVKEGKKEDAGPVEDLKVKADAALLA